MTIAANAQKTIVDVVVGSADHTTLVAAVKAADLGAKNGFIHVIDAVVLPK